MGLSKSCYKQLEQITGKEHVTADPEELLCYSYDATGDFHLPDAVISPGSELEVSKILKLANDSKLIVVPRGAGSGMTGGAVPVQGGLVMVFNRMNRILEIDEENLWIKVQPGVVVQHIHQTVESHGLFYPPDPASSAVCTIGGNIGECAGGPRAVKYGVTRDYVLGLKAVLASGEIIETGVKTAKGVAGYDLTRLIVGSEGTLAVVTEITLKLLPKPETVKTLAVIFDSMKIAARVVSRVMKEGMLPRCVEYLDHACLELIKNKIDYKLPDASKALLIIEVDGDKPAVERDLKRIISLLDQFRTLDIKVAHTKEDTQSLWKARKALSPVLFKIANNKINEDIVVPIVKIPDMVQVTQDIKESSGLSVVSFGHAGDGNIHCNIMYNKTDKDQTRRAHKAVDTLFEKTLQLGGTITGEHGVGVTKLKYLPGEVGHAQVELMRGIKQVFDPNHILNPGKIFH